MPLSEFSLIEKYFQRTRNLRADVKLGIGDDCAILTVPAQHELVVSMDTLVAGVHFFADTNPHAIGYKALAVNLSDLAAMGAEPAWVTLAITLPEVDESWLQGFCAGFFELLDQYLLQLIGGDTTRGPLAITIQAHGFVPTGQALRRDGAKPGDAIYVTGKIGEAGLALEYLRHNIDLPKSYQAAVLQRLHYPEAKVQQGLALRGLANSAIDISDGLAADLTHILKNSSVGATIVTDNLPIAESLKSCLTPDMASKLALTAGDDYELCFTVPAAAERKLTQVFHQLGPITCIGRIEEEPGLRLKNKMGDDFFLEQLGYQHF